MSQEQNYDNLSYDELLKMARDTSKIWISRLRAALRRENPDYSNYDIREIEELYSMAKGYNNRCFT